MTERKKRAPDGTIPPGSYTLETLPELSPGAQEIYGRINARHPLKSVSEGMEVKPIRLTDKSCAIGIRLKDSGKPLGLKLKKD